ncbi:hypothetical protein CORC01_07341 [Colletotrichum orchidophilum]|uniref:Uncharacterized protein n=1 Tax=Colletotrichum orchidophilum TaxID=1209926 RepID=A0A1G4B7H1_9PEZI|nr:uncharacterized protein CORC01_07341 [Colletotrichum orchidophilum]OHE97286.1 hypothetical protein CORC01_07341 [Colletotrichum orchidophilum]
MLLSVTVLSQAPLPEADFNDSFNLRITPSPQSRSTPKRLRRADLPSPDIHPYDSPIEPLAKEKLGQLGHTKGAVT